MTYALKSSDGTIIARSESPITVNGTTASTRGRHWALIPAGCYAEEEVDLSAARERASAAVRAKRDAVIEGGVRIGDDWFQTDTRSLVRVLGMLALGASLPAGLEWRTQDGGRKVPLTQGKVQQLFGAVVALEQAAFARADELLLQIEASDNPDSVNIHSGWPESMQA